MNVRILSQRSKKVSTFLHDRTCQPQTWRPISNLSTRTKPPEEFHHQTLSLPKKKPLWPNPVYQKHDLLSKIHVSHRPPRDYADTIALRMVRLLRWGMDFTTGYPKNAKDVLSKDADRVVPVPTNRSSGMNEQKWLTRFVFLESVAGVPGMVAGMLRHLHSLRRLKGDNGWIETLLEEAYNERMHLLSFLALSHPTRFTRLMIILAQGIFFNSFFVAYLISPRICHRFVGYLEEEAVSTYSLAIRDMDEGRLAAWADMKAPGIAVRYWMMPEGERGMRDLLMRVRADEAKHREVNHTLGNLDQVRDGNPFSAAFGGKMVGGEGPGKGIENIRGVGWEREEVVVISGK